MSTLTTYALRLPKSIKAEAEALSKADGTSLNQFVATAVAEKIAVLKTTAYFEERAARAREAAQRGEPSALMAHLARRGGDIPRDGDELPGGKPPQPAPVKPAKARAARKSTAAPRRKVKKQT